MKFYNFQRLLLVLALLSLFGCQIPGLKSASPEKPQIVDWHERQLLLAERPDWKISGRVAMQTKNDAWSASIKWIQIEDLYEIALFGPLGGKRLLIEGGDDHVILTTSDNQKFAETSAQRLIHRQTGWDMPVEGLRYWVLALMQPRAQGQQFFDDTGRLEELRQRGWVIKYRDYQLVDGMQMPRKIRLESERLTIKLVVNDWRFGLGKPQARHG